MMDREELIAMVAKMIDAKKTAADIVDEIIAALTPDDDEECPVCGLCP